MAAGTSGQGRSVHAYTHGRRGEAQRLPARPRRRVDGRRLQARAQARAPRGRSAHPRANASQITRDSEVAHEIYRLQGSSPAAWCRNTRGPMHHHPTTAQAPTSPHNDDALGDVVQRNGRRHHQPKVPVLKRAEGHSEPLGDVVQRHGDGHEQPQPQQAGLVRAAARRKVLARRVKPRRVRLRRRRQPLAVPTTTTTEPLGERRAARLQGRRPGRGEQARPGRRRRGVLRGGQLVRKGGLGLPSGRGGRQLLPAGGGLGHEGGGRCAAGGASAAAVCLRPAAGERCARAAAAAAAACRGGCCCVGSAPLRLGLRACAEQSFDRPGQAEPHNAAELPCMQRGATSAGRMHSCHRSGR